MSEKKEIEQLDDKFLAIVMKYDPNEDHRVVVFCEECDDLTIISTKTGVECGHTPRWLKNMEVWLGKVGNERQTKRD